MEKCRKIGASSTKPPLSSGELSKSCLHIPHDRPGDGAWGSRANGGPGKFVGHPLRLHCLARKGDSVQLERHLRSLSLQASTLLLLS